MCMSNKITQNTDKVLSNGTYHASLYRFNSSPLHTVLNNQYVACLHHFDCPEMIDGYFAWELADMIEFLKEVHQALEMKNSSIDTPSLFENKE